MVCKILSGIRSGTVSGSSVGRVPVTYTRGTGDRSVSALAGAEATYRINLGRPEAVSACWIRAWCQIVPRGVIPALLASYSCSISIRGRFSAFSTLILSSGLSSIACIGMIAVESSRRLYL